MTYALSLLHTSKYGHHTAELIKPMKLPGTMLCIPKPPEAAEVLEILGWTGAPYHSGAGPQAQQQDMVGKAWVLSMCDRDSDLGSSTYWMSDS